MDTLPGNLRFTLRQLVYFVAAGESGSIKVAAERVHISQPSVSAAISHLEHEFGVQLFVRHHARGLSLTAAGAVLAAEVKRILRNVEDLQRTADAFSTRLSGPLDVGCLSTLAPIVVPELARSFEDRYEQVKIRTWEGDQSYLYSVLRSSDIGLAVTYDLEISEDMDFQPLAQLPPYAYIAADHPLATRKSVTIADLSPLPLVLLDLPLSSDYFLALFEKAQQVANVYTVSKSMETARSIVARGYGYGLANFRPLNMAALDGKPLAYLPISGEPKILHIGLLTLKGTRFTRVAHEFCEHCRALISDEAIPGMAPLS